MGRIPLRNPQRHLGDFDLYAGSQWWTLSAEAIGHILSTIKERPDLARFFRYVRIPDESFFQTILGNSVFLGQCARGNVYTDWSNPKDAPCFIRASHLPQVLAPSFRLADDYGSGPALYARKFGSRNRDVISEIAKTFQRESEDTGVERVA
jgi:Core-2/I-Branching enzyme